MDWTLARPHRAPPLGPVVPYPASSVPLRLLGFRRRGTAGGPQNKCGARPTAGHAPGKYGLVSASSTTSGAVIRCRCAPVQPRMIPPTTIDAWQDRSAEVLVTRCCRGSPVRKWDPREHSLLLANLALFIAFFVGMTLTGWSVSNNQLVHHGEAAQGLGAYLLKRRLLGRRSAEPGSPEFLHLGRTWC